MIAGAVSAGAAACMAWAVRGRASQVFGPSVWRGPAGRRALALTFDDGPSRMTAELLAVLARFGVPATFFVCGEHVRRHPLLVREMAAAGHEIGNHTDTHARLWLRSPKFIRRELLAAQTTIGGAAGVEPRLFRATYGVRWFGLAAAQRELGLLHVMWTVVGLDWKLPAHEVARRITSRAGNGAIVCLHDGRERAPDPDITPTIAAVREIVPRLIDQGYEFRTVSGLIGYSSWVCPRTSSSASSV